MGCFAPRLHPPEFVRPLVALLRLVALWEAADQSQDQRQGVLGHGAVVEPDA